MNYRITILLAVLSLSSFLINAQTNCANFTLSQGDIGIESETFGVSLADFDGDGWKDVVTIDAYNDIEVYFNNGDGTFNTTPITLGGDSWRFGVEVIDIENDGDWDFITSPFSSSSGNGMEIWENDGTGSFTLKDNIVNNSSGYEFAVGDLNGDGYTDIFFPHGDIDIMLNDGTGNFVSNGQNNLSASSAEAVTLADFDGDNDLDAVVVRGGGAGFVGKYYINDGTGQFMDSGQELSYGCEGVAAGDIDADGDLDIAIAPWMGSVHFWLNDGLGNFMPGDTLHEINWFFNDIILKDQNFDGHVDIFTDTHIWLNDNNNPGNFILQDFEMDASNHDFEVADINNDNLPDIYLGRFSSNDGDQVFLCDEPNYIIGDTTLCFGDSIFLQNAWQTQPGSFLAYAGCDSLALTNLSFYDEINTEVTILNITLTATVAGADYQWLDCDNNFYPIEGETSQSFTPEVTGNYAVEITENEICSAISECYFVEVNYVVTFTVTDINYNPLENVNIQINNSDIQTNQSGTATIELPNASYNYLATLEDYADYSDTVVVNSANVDVEIILTETVGIKEGDNNELSISPNPSNGVFTVKMGQGLFASAQQSKLIVTDISGKGIKNYPLSKNYMEIDISKQPAGIYFINIKTDKVSIIRKIIKH